MTSSTGFGIKSRLTSVDGTRWASTRTHELGYDAQTLQTNAGPSNFDCEATDMGQMVQGTLHAVGAHSTGQRLPARHSPCYLLLEAS